MIDEDHRHRLHNEHHQHQLEFHQSQEISSGKFQQFNATNLMMVFSMPNWDQLAANKDTQQSQV